MCGNFLTFFCVDLGCFLGEVINVDEKYWNFFLLFILGYLLFFFLKLSVGDVRVYFSRLVFWGVF